MQFLHALLKGLPHDGEVVKKSQIILCEKPHCEFAMAVSRETGSSSTLNRIANHACKARADWLNHLNSPWEFAGYKVQSQNDQLHLT